MNVSRIVPVFFLLCLVAFALPMSFTLAAASSARERVKVYLPGELPGLSASPPAEVGVRITKIPLQGNDVWKSILDEPGGSAADPLVRRFNEILLDTAMLPLPQSGSLALLLDVNVLDRSAHRVNAAALPELS